MAQAQTSAALFAPVRRRGVGLHVSASLLLLVLAVMAIGLSLEQPPGAVGIALLVLGLALAALLPFLFYRLYSLIKSGYWVSRDGLRLRWGLRAVDLPLNTVVDVAIWSELEAPPRLPRWVWPGSLLGVVQDEELGVVEFLASDKEKLVLVGTPQRVYVLSPEEDKQFVAALKREALRGSLRPLRLRSASPSFVLVEAWGQKLPRRLIAGGGLLALGLLLLAGILAPGLPGVTLGFDADGQRLPLVASGQLLLLPALNLFFYMGNLMLGMLFFREAEGLNVSVLLWGGSMVTGLLFLGAIVVSIF